MLKFNRSEQLVDQAKIPAPYYALGTIHDLVNLR